MHDDKQMKICTLNLIRFTHNEKSYHARGDVPNNPLVSLDTLGVEMARSMINRGYEHL